MSDPTQNSAPPALQFDRAISSDGSTPDAAVVVCTQCKTRITDSYFAIGEKPFCARCKSAVDAIFARAKQRSVFAKAAVFGLGAAIAGAIVYYGVIALLHLEIGIV